MNAQDEAVQLPVRPKIQQRRDLAPGTEVNPALVASMRKQAQEQAQLAENRSLGDARRRIELITGLGRKIRDVDVNLEGEKHQFTLRTLKKFEQNCLNQVLENAKRVLVAGTAVGFTPTSMDEIKLEALSHSLFAVDGQSIDLVL